jgi:hypothetical protein
VSLPLPPLLLALQVRLLVRHERWIADRDHRKRSSELVRASWGF